MEAITIDEIEELTAMHGHELEALDLLYPDLLDRTIEQVSARFPAGNTEQAKRHIAALVAARLYPRLGTQAPDTQFHITAAADEAERFLTDAPHQATPQLPSVRPPRPTLPPKDTHG